MSTSPGSQGSWAPRCAPEPCRGRREELPTRAAVQILLAWEWAGSGRDRPVISALAGGHPSIPTSYPGLQGHMHAC